MTNIVLSILIPSVPERMTHLKRMIDTLCTTIASNSTADCIVFDVLVNYNNLFAKITKFGKEFEHKEDEWGARVSQDIVNQVRIPATLYHYDFVPKPASWYT